MNWMFYLKTTETCQLNCKHCFTSGINGKKIYFDHFKTIDFIKRFRQYFNKDTDTIHLEFHGGEPFLAPVSHMNKVYEECKDLWPNMSWGITSNLVFKLKEEHLKKIPSDMLIEQFNIRVNMHYTHATMETTTSSYDKSKHYLSYLK